MGQLDAILAFNGMAILLVSLIAGVLLYRVLLRQDEPHDWHLLHAGGSGRGVMLLALAATIHLADLPSWLLAASVCGVIFFAWGSTISMIITGITGEHGFSLSGSPINRFAHVLYVAGAIAVFPAVTILLLGFWRHVFG